MSAQPIAEFWKRKRSADTAVLLGKGPSLDAYPGRPDDVAYVMGINEVPFAVPCDGVVFMDGPLRKAPFPDALDLFRYKYADTHNGRGYYWRTGSEVSSDDPCRMVINPGSCGNACFAVTILATWGIRRLLLWGFDSIWGDAESYDSVYAERVKPHIQPGRGLPYEYGERGLRLVATLAYYKIDWSHFGKVCVH